MLAGSGQLLGWEDLMAGRKYTSSVRCVTPTGTLIKVDAQDLVRRLGKNIEVVK